MLIFVVILCFVFFWSILIGRECFLLLTWNVFVRVSSTIEFEWCKNIYSRMTRGVLSWRMCVRGLCRLVDYVSSHSAMEVLKFCSITNRNFAHSDKPTQAQTQTQQNPSKRNRQWSNKGVLGSEKWECHSIAFFSKYILTNALGVFSWARGEVSSPCIHT